MKKTLYLYVTKEIAAPFLLGISVFVFVLLMGRLLRLADLVIAKGVPFLEILKMVLYMLPSFGMVVIPMSFLFALLLAFGRLSSDNEITAMKAGGVSLYGLLPPVMALGLLACIATSGITLYALPWGNTSFKKFLTDFVERRAVVNIRERVFNDEFPGVVIYVDRYDEVENTITGILINDERNLEEPSTIFADRGFIMTEPEKSTIRLQLHNGGIHRTLAAGGYRLIEFSSYDLNINLSRPPREIVKNELDMTMNELKAGRRTAPPGSKLLRELNIEYHKRFALPVACLVFVIVGIPLGIQNQRTGKSGGFSTALAVIIFYYILFSGGRTLAEKGTLSPLIAMWGPNFLFALMGAYLFRIAASEENFPRLGLAFSTVRGIFTLRRSGKEGQ